MAHGSAANSNIGQVKATVSTLEVSPSHHSATSPIYHGGARATGHGSSTKTTGKLSSHGNKTRGKPTGTTTHIGKKSHSFQKSKGR